jgi:hypothetical protein
LRLGRGRHARPRWSWRAAPRDIAVGATLLLTACGGSAIAAHQSGGGRYAKTPTSPGALNPRAVPLGDGYVSSRPKVGYVDSCTTQFGGGGSQTEGPWINSKAKTWNYETKLTVNGRVHWPSSSYRVRTAGNKRVIAFNDLPRHHPTGVFPISSSDPSYQYDHNPNRIEAQSSVWKLALNPSAASSPHCTPLGPIGVLADGVALYNALDAQGRDAGAHEVLDVCAGHPDPSDTYHHHDIPPCLLRKAREGKATLVGYALDGYGIYVVKSRGGKLPTNTRLDACHGTTSVVSWNGKKARVYHYVATLEYPYTVGCFHGTPITVARQQPAGGNGGGPPGGGPPLRAAGPPPAAP